ncbi:MAG TPA: riboflavin synthase [Candidatus Norongarragalinales archaeon]|nr:riboflavin synthase [Candidatus Norongarragalinales archaeon]
MKYKIGVVDTTFARVDMAKFALEELSILKGVEIVRRTVPGIKDLAIECRRVLDSGADICIALGWVGGAKIDTQCAHEASMGIQQAKLLANKHILEAFVFEFEADSDRALAEIAKDRARKHALNAYRLVSDPASLSKRAGMGIRQGKGDAGPLK